MAVQSVSCLYKQILDSQKVLAGLLLMCFGQLPGNYDQDVCRN